MGMCSSEPDPPNPTDMTWAGAMADIETLPTRKQVENAAAAGQKVTIGGHTYDFTGLGEADFQAKYADAMAQTMLQLQQQYGPDYVTERLKELEQADPEGTQMRKDLWTNIQKQAEAPSGPMAGNLQSQILSDLNKGGSLTDQERGQAQQAVRGGQVARGNYLGNAAGFQEGQAVTQASEDKATQRQQQAIQFLSSGATPEDVQYRKDQQTLANLGAFINGVSPTAQFSQLAGAQNQVVPFAQAPSGSSVNPNAGAQAVQHGNQIYAAQSQWANNQVNPWLAGLQTMPSGAAIGYAVTPTGVTPGQPNYTTPGYNQGTFYGTP
jgi:hypothetical protein